MFAAVTEEPNLSLCQEEADTKLILHAKFAAAETNRPLVIVADDTDVLILALAHQADIPQRMFLLKGTTAQENAWLTFSISPSWSSKNQSTKSSSPHLVAHLRLQMKRKVSLKCSLATCTLLTLM